MLAHRVAQHDDSPASTGSPPRCSSPRWSSRRSAAGRSCPRSAIPSRILAGIGVGRLLVGHPLRHRPARDAPAARATYALMVSLLPATATVIGIVVLAQIPTAAEVAGVALVVAGVALHREAPARASAYASAARTCSSCVLGDTFANTCVTFPFGSITKVDRCVPMNFRPYMDFSTHTP